MAHNAKLHEKRKAHPLFSPPRLHHVDHDQERRVSWLELFYDLVYVATLIQLGNAFGENLTLEWPDIKSIKIIPVFKVYKMSLKTRKKPIYFLPSKNIEPAYDLLAEDTSKMGDIVNKNKKKLGI